MAILDKKENFLDELTCSTKMPLTDTAELLANIEHPKYTNDIEKIAYNISRDIKNVLSEQELIFGSLINNLPYKIAELKIPISAASYRVLRDFFLRIALL